MADAFVEDDAGVSAAAFFGAALPEADATGDVVEMIDTAPGNYAAAAAQASAEEQQHKGLCPHPYRRPRKLGGQRKGF